MKVVPVDLEVKAVSVEEVLRIKSTQYRRVESFQYPGNVLPLAVYR